MTEVQKKVLKQKLEEMKTARENWEKSADAPESSFKGGRREWEDSFQRLWEIYTKKQVVLIKTASHHIEELVELATKEA